MESKGFSEKHRVTYYETDMNGTVGLGRLVDLMMLSCNDQSDAVGLSSEKVNQMGLGWIVTQNMIDIKRLPRRNETIYITTHAKSYNCYFCYRDFWIHDIRKQELAHMHTVFALMDQNERKIVRIPENLIEPYHSEYATKIERLPLPKELERIDRQKEYEVRFWDIDINQHVNNVHYFEWMLDALDLDFLIKYQPVSMNIEYKKEIRYGQKAVSQAQITMTGVETVTTFHEIKVNDELSCRAVCDWKLRKEEWIM